MGGSRGRGSRSCLLPGYPACQEWPGEACSRADASQLRAGRSRWGRTRSRSRWSLNRVALALSSSAISGATTGTPSCVLASTWCSGRLTAGCRRNTRRSSLPCSRGRRASWVGSELLSRGWSFRPVASPDLMEGRLDPAPVPPRQRRPGAANRSPSHAGAETAPAGWRRAWRSRGRHAAASCVQHQIQRPAARQGDAGSRPSPPSPGVWSGRNTLWRFSARRPYSPSSCSRASPRVSQPCQTMTGSIARAPTASAHHQPNRA